MAKYFVITAILFAVASAIVQTLSARNATKSTKRKRAKSTLYISLSAIFTAAWVILLWFGQQQYTQEWNSRPILDIYVDKNKHLQIANRGLVDIEDVLVYATEYTLSEDYPLHVSAAKVASFGTMSRPVAELQLIPRESAIEFDLTKPTTLFKFYSELPSPGDKWSGAVYCLRVVFRNSITKQRFVRYVLTSPALNFPDPFGDYRDTASGGGYDTSIELLRVRELIRAHQASYYDDRADEFFRN